MPRFLVVIVLSLLAVHPAVATAEPITYQYVQTGGFDGFFGIGTPVPLPTFHVSATITIDGTFADLPSLGCRMFPDNAFACPEPDFGKLLDFDLRFFDLPTGYDLSTFSTFQFGFPLQDFPQWSITPTRIYFNNSGLDWNVLLTSGVITHGSDGFTPLPECSVSQCYATGYWTPVPEPSTLLLLGSGAGALAHRYRRRKTSSTASDKR